MKRSGSLINSFSIVVGIFLLAEGIWGLCSNVVFGAFTTNRIHAAIHLILGLIGIIAGMRKSARGYCTFLGVLLLIVGILHFMPVTGTYTSTWLNMNSAVAGVNILLGIVALVVALSTGPGREVKR